MKTIDCAILAGGKSSRMVNDKAFLKIGGKVMIEHVVETASRLLPKPKIITNAPEKYEFLNLPCYTDIIKNAGPLGGIYTALKKTTACRSLILACDLPFITAALIKLLTEDKSAYDVLTVDAGRGIEPLCAVYDINCIRKIEIQIDSGNFKISDFYESVNVKIILLKDMPSAFDSSILFNINTPAEYEAALTLNQNRKK